MASRTFTVGKRLLCLFFGFLYVVFTINNRPHCVAACPHRGLCSLWLLFCSYLARKKSAPTLLKLDLLLRLTERRVQRAATDTIGPNQTPFKPITTDVGRTANKTSAIKHWAAFRTVGPLCGSDDWTIRRLATPLWTASACGYIFEEVNISYGVAYDAAPAAPSVAIKP